MNDEQRNIYVRAALALHGYQLSEAHVDEIARQFARIAAVAEPMLDAELPVDSEPAPIFRP